MVKCGYYNCPCSRGELHGPFYRRVFWAEGKFRKKYVRLADLDPTRDACRRRQERERGERARRQANAQLIRDFKSAVRDVEQMMAEWRGG